MLTISQSDIFYSNWTFGFCRIHFEFESGQEVLGNVVDNLNSTEDGESCEEPHGASDDTQLALNRDLNIPLNLNNELNGIWDVL